MPYFDETPDSLPRFRVGDESIWRFFWPKPILPRSAISAPRGPIFEFSRSHRVTFPHGYRAFRRTGCGLTWLLVVLACAGESGCVQRRLTIRSNPPGALVYVDDYQLGTTPVSTDFVYYGTRKIRLVKSGHETLTVLQPIPTPWYEYPGLDFISENLIPGEIRDERVVDYQLQPQMVVPSPQLLERGENLRRGAGIPQGPAPPSGPTYGPPRESRPGLPASPPPATRPGSPFNY